MKKIKFILSFLIVSLQSTAQQAYDFIEINNIRCSVTSTGDLFFVPDTELGSFEVPAGSGLHSIFASNLWFGGLSSDQQLKLAAEMYEEYGTDWFPGPLSNDANAETSTEVMEAYNQVWHVTSQQAALHEAYFDALQNGTVDDEFPNGYTIPDVFLTWPAHGNTALGQDYFLAPFSDYNGDNSYDPNYGDTPLFCGEECIYFIYNDKGNVHTESGGQPIGLEVHGMLYGFDSVESEMLNNTVFLKLKIINRGMQTLTDTYAGIWTDFDLGNPMDDFIGTNVHRSTVYALNGDALDENQYEDDLCMQGMTILAGVHLDQDEMDNDALDIEYSGETDSYGPTGYGFDDGIVDNERFGMTNSISFTNSGNGNNGFPENAMHYKNYMRSIYKNGAALLYPNTGYFSKYFAPNTSDPLGIATGFADLDPWTELNQGNQPGERQAVGSCGPFTLEPGDVNTLDVAYVFARESQTNGESLEELFDDRLKEAKLFFNEFLVECSNQDILLSTTEILPSETVISVFPNPAKNHVNIQVHKSGNNIPIQITDVTGQIVQTLNLNHGLNQVSLPNLAPGIYFIQTAISRVKLIVE
jgi:Secretion system C-terminal sorting domain